MQNNPCTNIPLTQKTNDEKIEGNIVKAIELAHQIAERNGCKMTVVKTTNYGICVYSGFEMKVRKDEIVDICYDSVNGYNYSQVA